MIAPSLDLEPMSLERTHIVARHRTPAQRSAAWSERLSRALSPLRTAAELIHSRAPVELRRRVQPLEPAARRALAFHALRHLYVHGGLVAGGSITDAVQAAFDAVPGEVMHIVLSEEPVPFEVLADDRGRAFAWSPLDEDEAPWTPVLGTCPLLGAAPPAPSSPASCHMVFGWSVPWGGELAILSLLEVEGPARSRLAEQLDGASALGPDELFEVLAGGHAQGATETRFRPPSLEA